jgi:hypothetical protein
MNVFSCSPQIRMYVFLSFYEQGWVWGVAGAVHCASNRGKDIPSCDTFAHSVERGRNDVSSGTLRYRGRWQGCGLWYCIGRGLGWGLQVGGALGPAPSNLNFCGCKRAASPTEQFSSSFFLPPSSTSTHPSLPVALSSSSSKHRASISDLTFDVITNSRITIYSIYFFFGSWDAGCSIFMMNWTVQTTGNTVMMS